MKRHHRLALILLIGTIVLIMTLLRAAPDTAFAPGDIDATPDATIEMTH